MPRMGVRSPLASSSWVNMPAGEVVGAHVWIKPYGNAILIWTVQLGNIRKMLAYAMFAYANQTRNGQ